MHEGMRLKRIGPRADKGQHPLSEKELAPKQVKKTNPPGPYPERVERHGEGKASDGNRGKRENKPK